jgi:hypothetical protein
MNFLSHHHVALRLEPDAAPAFYVGNVLPDLLPRGARRHGERGGRLRPAHLPASPDPALARGVGLHLAADRRFHGSDGFRDACAEAGALLRAALGPSAPPAQPRRVFFLAHVFVEIALDAVLIRGDDGIADDLYAQFERADRDAIAAATETMLGRPLPGLAAHLTGFARAGWLYEYRRDAGLVDALERLSRRAGLAGFAPPEVRERVGVAFGRFLPRAAALGPALWDESAPAAAW